MELTLAPGHMPSLILESIKLFFPLNILLLIIHGFIYDNNELEYDDA